MEIFHGDNNQLRSFPIQPKMKEFHGENNKLVWFEIQPKMKKQSSIINYNLKRLAKLQRLSDN
jgi:hypothetical protein